jgi:hypothetical protein
VEVGCLDECPFGIEVAISIMILFAGPHFYVEDTFSWVQGRITHLVFI